MSGYLRWKDRKRWARNWFSLAGSSLHVFESSEDAHAFHVIRLEGYSVEPVHPDNVIMKVIVPEFFLETKWILISWNTGQNT